MAQIYHLAKFLDSPDSSPESRAASQAHPFGFQNSSRILPPHQRVTKPTPIKWPRELAQALPGHPVTTMCACHPCKVTSEQKCWKQCKKTAI